MPVRLSGSMGVAELVFTVLAFNAPLSIAVGFIPVVIGAGNGLGAPLIFVVCAVLLIVFAVGFTTMGRHLPNPGAYYAYITAGLGRPLGLGCAFVAVFAYFFILIGSYAFGGITLQALVRDMLNGPDIEWWVWVLVLQAVAGVLGYFRISLSAKILTVAMCLEVVVIVAYNAVVLFRGGPQGRPVPALDLSNFTSGAVGLALLFGVTCFAGFEATAVFREETRDPARTVPRAAYLSVIVMAVMYAVTTGVVIIAFGPDAVVAATGADPTGAMLGSFRLYLGQVAVDIVNVLLCSSIFAAVLATHNVCARYLYSLSVDAVLPRSLSVVHPRHASPHRASVAVSALVFLATAVLLTINLEPLRLYAALVGIGGYALLFLLLCTAVAVIPYLTRMRRQGRAISPAASVAAPGLSAMGLAFVLALASRNVAVLFGATQAASNVLLAVVYGLVLVGVVYGLWLRSRKPEVYQRIGRQDI
ncbi:APC family permease [Kineococcus rhizosphaerae]|uniref:Amino acid transporter n=1 Tax=Kineococcus rhizosphaerae TaxID=559628 RepID=A0A2T0QUR7_9ACTN|nr:APC family permease [Kineococcus rhizosphaerae]PRY08832.1 amino acid transporter [Kineococcus rhizosphaerae]